MNVAGCTQDQDGDENWLGEMFPGVLVVRAHKVDLRLLC